MSSAGTSVSRSLRRGYVVLDRLQWHSGHRMVLSCACPLKIHDTPRPSCWPRVLPSGFCGDLTILATLSSLDCAGRSRRCRESTRPVMRSRLVVARKCCFERGVRPVNNNISLSGVITALVFEGRRDLPKLECAKRSRNAALRTVSRNPQGHFFLPMLAKEGILRHGYTRPRSRPAEKARVTVSGTSARTLTS